MIIDMGFEALHGEVSIYIWFVVPPCVYLPSRVCSLENNLSCYIFYYRGADFRISGDFSILKMVYLTSRYTRGVTTNQPYNDN